MKTPVKYALVIALIALAVMPLAAAVDVTVTVVDKDDNPIDGATVKITNSGNATDVPCSGTTDDKGDLDDTCVLESDVDYTITVTHSDYQGIDDDKTLKDFKNAWQDIGVVMRPKTFDLTVTVCSGGSGTSCGSSSELIKDADITVESLDEELLETDFDNYDKIVFPKEKDTYVAFEVDSDKSTQTTDNDGVAVIEGLEFNTMCQITVEKAGYPTTLFNVTLDKPKNYDVPLKLVEPGTATFTAIVYDQETNELIAGATVKAKNKDTNKEQSEVTNTHGAATFNVATPGCYAITASKDNYGSDDTEECFENDDNVPSLPLFLVSQNRAPRANAGPDQYVLVGTAVTLDASSSTDPDEDELTYDWSDTLHITIPSVEKPQVTFDTVGEHVITLTVSDGTEESTDTMTVYVDKRENCGDNFCSLAENATKTCPKDCPVCLDEIKGAGECIANTSFYCPVDCGIKATVRLLNATQLIPGNTTTVEVYDPVSKAPVIGADLTVILPNGTVLTPRTLMGKAEVNFPAAGKYTFNVTAPKYVSSSTVIEVRGGWDLSWLMWPAIIVVLALVGLRAFNYIRINRGSHGYRAKKFRKGKSTLGRL
jgi:hypothetical protein